MAYELISKAEWQSFIEGFSKQLAGRRVEIEVMGLDLGDQVEAEWLPLGSLAFEAEANTLRVHFANEHELEHRIEAPEQIWAEIEGGELRSLVVMRSGDHKEILRFRAPFELPPRRAGRDQSGAAPL